MINCCSWFACCASILFGATPLFSSTFTYSYDSLNRLANAAYADGSRESYSYDPAGNRLSRTTSAATVTVDVTPPSVPVNLTTNGFTPSQLSIVWNRAFDTGGSGLAGYQIYVNGSPVATTANTNCLLTGLMPNTQYCLTVAAYDHATNISAASLPVCVTTSNADVSLPPPWLTGMSVSNGLIMFALNGLAGSNYVIQTSSNLVNWNVFLTDLIPVGGVRVIDIPILTNQAQMFYRALLITHGPLVLQPGPVDGKDIWTTSSFSYADCSTPHPGGGKNDERLRVGGWGDLYYSLVQFDLTVLPTNATSAVLYFYCFNLSGGGTPLYLDRITSSWNWRTQGTGCDRLRLWWVDKPSTVQWVGGQIPTPTLGQWYAVDITTLYNAWQNSTYPNYGLQFRPVLNSTNNFDEFYSSDYTGNPNLRPKLVVTPAN
jgi:YD repeat-containing protein